MFIDLTITWAFSTKVTQEKAYNILDSFSPRDIRGIGELLRNELGFVL